MTVKDKTALSAAVTPFLATDSKVKWSVTGTDADAVELYSDESCETPVGTEATDVLKVYVKAVKGGSAVVTATSNSDNTKSAFCAVTVKKKKQTVTEAGPKEGLVYNGENQYLFGKWPSVTDGVPNGHRFRFDDSETWSSDALTWDAASGIVFYIPAAQRNMTGNRGRPWMCGSISRQQGCIFQNHRQSSPQAVKWN